jgi:HPt (histidine-containing phosphotransfer) domain-containing protein
LKEQFFDDRKLPPVDMACLQELRDLTLSNGNPGRFRRLVETFQDALELQLGLMRRALAAGNSDDIADLAHSLKGSAACIGAGYLSSLCSTLEIVSSSTTPDEPKRLFRQIETEAQLVHRILQKEATS